MIAPSLHPDTVRAACEPRGRCGFGLTTRTICSLIAGFAFLIPGFWMRASATPCWRGMLSCCLPRCLTACACPSCRS